MRNAGANSAAAVSAAAATAAAQAPAAPPQIDAATLPTPTPATTAGVAASVLQARIATAVREEQAAAAQAAAARKAVLAMRQDLQMFAAQAVNAAAQPLERRATTQLPARAKRPREEDWRDYV